MASFKIEQRRLNFRGRDYHFVSYEGKPAHERRGELAEPPMWCLMNEGKRRPVMPHTAGQDAAEVDRALLHWVAQTIGTEMAPAPTSRRPF